MWPRNCNKSISGLVNILKLFKNLENVSTCPGPGNSFLKFNDFSMTGILGPMETENPGPFIFYRFYV